MKKIISYLLCSVMMLSTFCVINASTNVDIDDLVVNDKTVNYTEDFEMTFEIDGLDYYPFIYHESNEWFIENVIGPTSCQEGYLYSKNLESGQIIKLVSQPVEIFREDESGVYFICENNLFFVDYNGNNIEKVYAANGVLNTEILEVYGDDIYFCEGNKIVKYNRDTDTKSIVAKANNVTMLYIKSDKEIVYQNGNEVHYLNINSTSKSRDVVIDDEYDYNSLFVSDSYDRYASSTKTVSKPVDTNLSNVTSTYPIGSYFSDYRTKCTHHGNCDYYGGCDCVSYASSIQCMGYARWAFDKYAHLSSWRDHVEGLDNSDVNFQDNSDVIAFFSSCSAGAYIRLKRSGSGDYGFHSIFYTRKTSSSVTTYECNLYGGCEIKSITRQLSAYRSFCSGVTNHLTHCYGLDSSYISNYNSTYHIQRCWNSGCTAYRFEQHYALSTSSTVTTCTACGYVGNIIYREPLD